MNKSLNLLIVTLLVILFLLTTKCFAANIDMNLSADSAQSNTSVSGNTVESQLNDIDSNTVSDNMISYEDADYDDSEFNSTSNSTTNTALSTSPSADMLQALPESELGLANILDILLIAVGIVLILLAIAIFIRLKK